MAYFCHPVHDTRLEAVPSKAVEALAGTTGVGEEGKVMTAYEHMMGRLQASYLSLYQDKDKDKSDVKEGEAAK